MADYHGAISGEHGVGRSRSWFLPQLLGAGLYEAMVAVKDAFDPRRLLNPGVVVDGPAVTESLRFGADYRGDHGWTPRLSYAAEGGFGLAVEKCFGAGLCKKLTGTMCPPGSGDARRVALHAGAGQRAAGRGVRGGAAWRRSARTSSSDVLGTCVACKACKTECPAGVDMAALKVEWLAEVRAREGVPLLARGIGDFRRLAGLAAPVAPLVNRLGRTRAARLLTDRAGVAHERPLPAFARAAAHAPVADRARPAPPAVPGRTATLFVDCFIQYQEPGIGEALARLLAAAGVRLELADAGCCGRTALSTGQIDKARAAARRALDGLYPLAAAGADAAVRRAVVPVDGARRLGAPAAARRARGRGGRREQAGARARGRPGRGGPPALPCRRPRPAAQPLPREGARLCRRDAGRARRACPASRWTTRTPAAAACPGCSGTRPATTR